MALTIQLVFPVAFSREIARGAAQHVSRVVEQAEVVTAFIAPRLTARAFSPHRNQYDSSMLLKDLAAIAHKTDKVILILDVDLFAPGLNFVFGQAECPGGCAVVSTYRLKDKRNPSAFLTRLTKEVVHELGHTFGLSHCRLPVCVMFFSNSLRDTDSKSDHFCADCKSKIMQAQT